MRYRFTGNPPVFLVLAALTLTGAGGPSPLAAQPADGPAVGGGRA